MSGITTVTNRQRRLPIDLKWFRQMSALLRQAVFADLIQKRPPHLKANLISKLEKEGEFSVVLVSDKQIQALNKEWMDKDRPTDVLSFPLSLDMPLSPHMPWEVGEIVISLETAQRQADELGHSLQRELAFLYVHGMLHVLGFDHMEPDEEKEMFGRQKRILDQSGFKRELKKSGRRS